MRSRVTCALAVLFLAAPGIVSADVLYEDVFYWMPDGTTRMNPSNPPEEAYIKVQETVYNDEQGRQIIAQLEQIGATQGGPMPADPIDLYAYSITNLNYDNGPVTGLGAGITGFDIIDMVGIPSVQWSPTAANGRWMAGFGPAWSWDIDANGNSTPGDGHGIYKGQTFNSFYIAVPAGTEHSVTVPAAVHTWTGAGTLEDPDAVTTDMIRGLVSGPVPEPASLVLLSLGTLLVARRRRR